MSRSHGPQALLLVLLVALAGCSGSEAGGGALPTATSTHLQAKHAPSGSYLYVENQNSTISAFSVAENGALSEISGSPFASETNGPSLFSIAVNPKGPDLYVTGTVSQNLAIFSIGSGGGLTLVSDSTSAGDGANFPLLSEHDKRLYVVNVANGGAVDAFDLVKKGSRAKPIAGSPFSVTCPGFCDPNPGDAVIGGSYLYTVDTYGWYVSTFSISRSGALTELSSYATGYGPAQAVMTPKGTELYVTNGAQGSVSGYSVAAGVLTPLMGSPFSAGATPLGIVMTPNGKNLYVANQGDGTISGYSIGSGGALTALSGSPFADGSGTSPTAVVIDRDGKHLFVTNDSTNAIVVYAIDGSGAIKQVAGSPFAEKSGAGGPQGLALF
jgi:6-phosphogluconolactonase (cycloisomerase 2 family)